MRIKAIMSKDVATIPAKTTLRQALCRLQNARSRLLYVVDSRDVLEGVVSVYDLLKVLIPDYMDTGLARVLSTGEEILVSSFEAKAETPISSLMSTKLITVSPDDTIIEAQALIKEKGVNVLPVVDEYGMLKGEITRRGIANYVAEICCKPGV